MDVLHAFWDDSENGGTLHVWGESADKYKKRKRANTGPRTAASYPNPRILAHPYALPQKVIKEIGRRGLALDVVPRNLGGKNVLNLPSVAWMPCPSPELVRVVRAADRPPDRWSSWEVTTLSVPHDMIYFFFKNLMKELETSKPPFRFGTSLWYWLNVLQFAEYLVVCEEFVPRLKEKQQRDSISYEAHWGALTALKQDWEDPEQFLQMSYTYELAMPPACYADFHDAEVLSLPARRAALVKELFRSFLSVAVDSFVRETLSHHAKYGSVSRKSLAQRGHAEILHSRKKTLPSVLTYLWVNDLLSKDRTLAAINIPKSLLQTYSQEATYSSGQLAWAFAREIEAKTRIAVQKVGGPTFEVCFRLVEPISGFTDDEGVEVGEENEAGGVPKNGGNTQSLSPWELHMSVRLHGQPEYAVEAAQVWATTAPKLVIGCRVLSNPQQFLMEKLAAAGRYWNVLQSCLQSPYPSYINLTTDQAYHFLNELGQKFARDGYGVIYPPWWATRGAELSAVLHLAQKETPTSPRMPAMPSNLFTTATLMDYNWKLAIGDEVLSPAEFNRLVKESAPLICFRGNWVEITPARRQQLLNLTKKPKKVPWEMTFGKALRIALGQEILPEGIRVKRLEGDAEIQELIDRIADNAKFTPVPPPQTFIGQLRPYQINGLSWLEFLGQFQLGACLADDMGLGKTIQVIALLLRDKERRNSQQETKGAEEGRRPNLLICPTSIVGNWGRELKRFAPSLSYIVHHGANRLNCDFQDKIQAHDLVITTYALVHRDAAHLVPIAWDYVIVDEAQNIKNHLTKQSQAIKQLQGTHRIALTGTPVENRLGELWSIMEFLNPGYLGNFKEFHTSFEKPIAKNHDPEKTDSLKRVIQPFILRRVKTDKAIIQDLPEKMEFKVYCNITLEQAALYQGLVDIMLGKIEGAEGIERKGLILATLLKLKQVCDHPMLIQKDQDISDGNKRQRSGKLTRLEEMLEEVLAMGEKALIFTQFVKMGTFLQHYLANQLECEVLFLHGSTTLPQREEMISRFQDDPLGPPIFILSLKAGGVGLNLTAANHVFHYDRWWNPAVENQATDRTFRIGQTKNVQVHKFICNGTLEEHIDEMIEEKVHLAENIIGGGESWLTEMSTDQLKTIFTLRRDVIDETCED